MKFGISQSNIVFSDGDRALEVVRAVERAGFESLFVSEHVVIPEYYEPVYPEAADGRLTLAFDGAIADPLVWLSFVAAAAPTMKLGTGILIVPQRNPLVTAKAVATLDHLTKGRVLLGVGAGWMREEFEALGVPFEGRGRRLEEYVEIMRGLWANELFAFEGEFFSFPEVYSIPKPVESRVPIHVGGYGELAARRAGRIGDGFFPGTSDPAGLEWLVPIVRRSAEQAGRDPDAIEVTARGTMDVDQLRAMKGAGADRVLLPSSLFDPEDVEGSVATFGREIIEPLS